MMKKFPGAHPVLFWVFVVPTIAWNASLAAKDVASTVKKKS